MNIVIQLPQTNDMMTRSFSSPTSPTSTSESLSSESSWSNDALAILESHVEMEQRHFIIDSLIEYIQKHYEEASNRLIPPQKAFSFFFQEKKPKIEMVHKIRGPNEKFQIAKKVSTWWRRLTSDEKKIYYLLESVDQLRYDQENDKIKNYLDKDIENVENMRDFMKNWPSEVIEDWINAYKHTCISKIY